MATNTQSTVVRKPAPWMRPADDRILETFADLGNLTPKAVSREGMHERVDIGRKYAGMRCRELARHGLLAHVDEGLFTITDEGLAYLNASLDVSTLEPPEAEP